MKQERQWLQQIKQQQVMRSYVERNRESNSMIYGNRRYMKKGLSPDTSAYINPCIKSNQQLLSQIAPHLHSQNNRPHDKSLNNFTTNSKLGNRDDLINYELLGISSSKNISDQRKKGRSSYYKKIVDYGNSEWLLGEQPNNSQVKNKSKMNSQEETFQNQPQESQVEELHYRMVEFQQKYKRMVTN